jgi:hypothetical protein
MRRPIQVADACSRNANSPPSVGQRVESSLPGHNGSCISQFLMATEDRDACTISSGPFRIGKCDSSPYPPRPHTHNHVPCLRHHNLVPPKIAVASITALAPLMVALRDPAIAAENGQHVSAGEVRDLIWRSPPGYAQVARRGHRKVKFFHPPSRSSGGFRLYRRSSWSQRDDGGGHRSQTRYGIRWNQRPPE